MRKFEKISMGQAKKDGVLLKNVRLPKRASDGSAGYDLYSPQEISLKPGEHISVALGLKVYMNDDEVLLINSRSGQGFKQGIRLRNVQGWIDSDYVDNPDNEGHLLISLKNDGDKVFKGHVGDAIAQAMFICFLKTDDDATTGRARLGGCGSTD